MLVGGILVGARMLVEKMFPLKTLERETLQNKFSVITGHFTQLGHCNPIYNPIGVRFG